MGLDKKVCVITGSFGGIGRAVALDFAKAGATVVINAASENDAEKNTLNELLTLGANAKLICADVSKSEEAVRLIAEVFDAYGRIDVLVNNAEITRDSLMLRMNEEAWDSVIDVNLKGPFNCIKAVSRIMMKQNSGSIINITSVVDITGNAEQANYSAAKAGLIGLTKTTAKEFAQKGIRCNAVAPGFIRSEMTDVLPEEIKQKHLESIPLAKFGTGEDVAKLCRFLASDLSCYITGQVINVDGGLVM